MSSALRLPQTRWGAFLGHLFISALIFLALFALIAYAFFPGALFWVAGGLEGIRIIAGVDLVLGPLLTLVIYNIAKPRNELYRDLAIIGSVQVSALIAGMAIVYASRPAAVTWVYNKFETVKAGEFDDKPAGLSGLTPTLWYVELPANDAQAQGVVGAHAFAEETLRERSDLYQPLPEDRAAMLRVMRGKASEEGDCLQVDIVTAFDARKVCFESDSRRFRLEP